VQRRSRSVEDIGIANDSAHFGLSHLRAGLRASLVSTNTKAVRP
jgi:hypothetical protein